MGMNTSTVRSITYNGDRIEYELTIKRVKNMNMRITWDGLIHVSADRYIPVHVIDKFVIENMSSIERARYKIDTLNVRRSYGSSKWGYSSRNLCTNKN